VTPKARHLFESIRLGSNHSGAIAGRASSLGADGSSAPSHRPAARLAVFVLAATLVFLAAAPSAFARTFDSSFGTFTGGDPSGVAVDQSNGDIYVTDFGNASIHRYDSSGSPKNFTAGLGVGTNTLSGYEWYFASSASVAVDNSSGPAAGSIYVGSAQGIDVYAPTGAHLGTLHGTGTSSGAIGYACGVAVDQENGDLYVTDVFTSATVSRFSPISALPSESSYVGEIVGENPPFGPCSVAADGGKVYVAGLGEGPARRYAASAFTPAAPAATGTLVDETATALATDPSTGDVYVDEGNKIAVFDSAGALQYVFGSVADFGTDSNGVAVIGSNGKAYVSDRTNGEVDVYGPSDLATKPAVTTKAATAINPDAATLNAAVNPNRALVTDCHFEYADDLSFQANGFTGASTAPCVPDPGLGSSRVAVSANISGLTNRTTYHFRVVATNSVGTRAADPRTFETTPIAFTDPVTNVSHHTNATLKGHFELQGDPGITNCQFDWGTTTAYGNSVDCAEGDSFSEPAEVSAFINNLTPGETVHYRLHLTTTSHGEALGHDRTFKPDDFPFLHELTDTIGSPGSGAGQFAAPVVDPTGVFITTPGATAVAVDQQSGDVYVADTGNHRLVKLDADGNFVSTWGWGVSDGSNAYQVCTSSCQAGIPGSGVGQFVSPRYVAVDNSGDVFVSGVDTAINSGNATITKFDSSGNLVTGWGTSGQLRTGATFRGSDFRGLTIDSSGYLYTAIGNEIFKLDSTTGNVVGTIPTGESPNSSQAISAETLAVEPGGTFLLLDRGRARRFDPSLPGPPSTFTNGFFVTRPGTDKNGKDRGRDLAVDPANGELYVAHFGFVSIYRFDLLGNVVEADGSTCTPDLESTLEPGTEGCDSTQTFGVGELTFSEGIGLNGADHKAYVTDSGQLKIFSGFLSTAPTLTREDPSDLTGTSATLHAKVDPEGMDVTDCHFSYVDDVEFQANGYANATQVSCDPDPGSGSGDVAVSAGISGLDPATLYHFRIEAENASEHGSAVGLDQTFFSRGPLISHTRANPITATDAVLGATINPQGSPTTYHFDYGPTSAYGSSTQESGAIGGNTDHAANQQIVGLAPATTYHFRIVAKNQFATVASPDVTFTTAGATDPCPNAALRTGHGFSLPDCRAYEQASPIDKHGAHALTSRHFAAAATDGNAVTFIATAGLQTTGGESRPYPVLARRGASGWSTNGLIPLLPPGHGARLAGWDSNLTTTVSTDDSAGTFYIGDTAAGTWASAPFSGPALNFLVSVPAFSDDPEHFLVSDEAALTPDAVDGKPNLYAYDHGSLSLAGRIPAFPATSCDDDGGPACVTPSNGALAGTYRVSGNQSVPDVPAVNTISGDGSRIVFTELGSGRIYLREDGTRTVQVSASQATSPDPNGHKPAAWMGSSHDGKTIYFASCEKLTDDSTAVSTAANECGSNQGSDLYAYDADTGELTDLTVDNESDPKGADVQNVIGISPDGSDLYFGANGRLAPGAPGGNCNGTNGACELYLIHDGGAPVDVGTVSGADLRRSEQDIQPARIADDGTLLLASRRQLTSYDNFGPTCGSSGTDPGPGRCQELYRYRPGDPLLTCISCSPIGGTAVGDAELTLSDGAAGVAEPPQTFISTQNLSADGNRVFFSTPDALVPADSNGDGGCITRDSAAAAFRFACTDVYEWEAEGTGSCDSAAENGGCLYLLSSGTSSNRSFFVDASASGDDVFIRTLDRLVPQDQDNLYDVYDARVGGGFAYQHPVSPPPCGSAEQCRGAGTATPPRNGAGSAAFSGPGSPAVNRKAKKKHKKKRHQKARKHKRSQKRANAKPGGSK
jgi:DNA-binding beta-propeller fold protein YncE